MVPANILQDSQNTVAYSGASSVMNLYDTKKNAVAGVMNDMTIRCRNCGRDCEITHSITTFIKAGVYQTTRYYTCPRCGSKYEITNDPKKVKK